MNLRSLLPLTMFATACLFTTAAHAKRPPGKGPCKDAAECSAGVCVEVNGDAYCSQGCGSCPGGMYCDANLFKMMGVKVCLRGAADAPVEPKQPPRMPCSNDNQCEGALICAQMMGHRDCTLPCKRNEQCEMPEMMGVKMDFMECSLDESMRSRKACLPKRKCLADPASCMTVNSKKMADGVAGMAGMAEGMANAMEGAFGAEPSDSSAPLAQEAPPSARSTNDPMSDDRFQRLLKQLRDTGFDDERATLLTSAAKRNWFTCNQLGRVIDVLGFGDERVNAVKIFAPRLVDKDNSHEVLAHLEFDDEKKAAAKILDR